MQTGDWRVLSLSPSYCQQTRLMGVVDRLCTRSRAHDIKQDSEPILVVNGERQRQQRMLDARR